MKSDKMDKIRSREIAELQDADTRSHVEVEPGGPGGEARGLVFVGGKPRVTWELQLMLSFTKLVHHLPPLHHQPPWRQHTVIAYLAIACEYTQLSVSTVHR